MSNSRVSKCTKSINHWKRMIKYAAKQQPYDLVNCDAMVVAINEDWFSEDCSLCESYNVTEKGCKYCPNCPIVVAGFRDCETYESVWWCVHKAHTWWTWLIAARSMLVMLETVRINELKKVAKKYRR